MSMPYGSFTAYGVQSGFVGGGSVTLGPLLIPFGSNPGYNEYTIGSGLTLEVFPPAGSVGVWIIPSGTTGEYLLVGAFTSTEYNIPISATQPSFLSWSEDNFPTQMVITGSVEGIPLVLQYV